MLHIDMLQGEIYTLTHGTGPFDLIGRIDLLLKYCFRFAIAFGQKLN